MTYKSETANELKRSIELGNSDFSEKLIFWRIPKPLGFGLWTGLDWTGLDSANLGSIIFNNYIIPILVVILNAGTFSNSKARGL